MPYGGEGDALSDDALVFVVGEGLLHLADARTVVEHHLIKLFLFGGGCVGAELCEATLILLSFYISFFLFCIRRGARELGRKFFLSEIFRKEIFALRGNLIYTQKTLQALCRAADVGAAI